jgi:HEAT repeat protein
MEAYLVERGKRDLFDDTEFFTGCSRLSSIVGDRDSTILLAKLYAEQMVTLKEKPAETQLPENIPDLMLEYINELNHKVGAGRLNDREVHNTAKLMAWECLRRSYRPSPAKVEEVFLVLGQRAGELIDYFEKRLRLVQIVGAGRDRIRFTLDPLAEYLAALHLIHLNGLQASSWLTFFANADSAPGAPEAIQGFVLTLRDCCLTKYPGEDLPDFILSELAKRAALDPDVLNKAHLERQLKHLIGALTLPQAVERDLAAQRLESLGHDAEAAIPALVRTLKDVDVKVRLSAAWAIGHIAPSKASEALLSALGDTDPVIRQAVAWSVGEMGVEGKSAIPVLLPLLTDDNDGVRSRVAEALRKLGYSIEN